MAPRKPHTPSVPERARKGRPIWEAIIEKRGARKSPPRSLSQKQMDHIRDFHRKSLSLANAIMEIEGLVPGPDEIHPYTREEEIIGPTTLTMPYRFRWPVKTSLYTKYDQLETGVTKALLSRLDKRGLLEWVLPSTRPEELDCIAKWSVGPEDEWLISKSGVATTSIYLDEQGNKSDVFHLLNIGWAHNTRWWNLVRFVVAESIRSNLFNNTLAEELDQLLEQTGYNAMSGTFDEAALCEAYGLESRDEMMAECAGESPEFIHQVRDEWFDRFQHIRSQQWTCPWFHEVVFGLMKKHDPSIDPSTLCPDPLWIGLSNTLSMLEDMNAYRDLSEKSGINKPVYTNDDINDHYYSIVAWGGSDLLATMIDETIDMYQQNYRTVIGTKCRVIKDGEVHEKSDLFLFPIREKLRNRLEEWMNDLSTYHQHNS